MSDMVNYGIDLGTTNSAIAKYEGDAVRVFKNRDQMDVTPSVVRVEKSGRIIVGKRAYNTLFADPDNAAAEFKRWMGQSDRKNFLAVGKLLSAEDLSAEVLKSLIEDAKRQTTDVINAAVITVPAAFGQLQCEATARAASQSGLNQAYLLQEPLAAAIAYGMKPEASDKRWLVYDLGGGTFDIAVVSTRNGQLSVLEHKGDNMLGGKDFDRLIVENIFWPRLEESFNLPQPDNDPVARKKLMQFLRGKAEEVKIDLSLSERVEISIFDIGTDRDGNLIELEFELKRAELNQLVEPFIAKTIKFCKEALDGARLSNKEVAAVMLVGGPTHMPIVRDMITSELGVKLDYSIDPMTVVARGAAIYASTLPLKQESPITTKPGSIKINLAHEAVWAETTCMVAGSIEKLPSSVRSLQILIEAEAGHWNSGWLPLQNGYFEANVHLLQGKTTRFWIYLRDEKGNDFTLTPDSFSIRHGLSLTE
ncbi:Hsp70 family protein, partial [bacterium]|nr:Hsp70 family protein [bacterium]